MLRAALDFADENGIETLSMRKLGQELGVEAMSLYNHVANKDDILDGIADAVWGEIDATSDETDWKTAIRRSAVSAHEAFLRHRRTFSLVASRGGLARLRYIDSVLANLQGAGFSDETTYHALHVLDGYIFGFTLQMLNFEFDAEELGNMTESFFREISADAYPYLSEHVKQHVSRHGDTSGFEFGLDLILDGLGRIRSTT